MELAVLGLSGNKPAGSSGFDFLAGDRSVVSVGCELRFVLAVCNRRGRTKVVDCVLQRDSLSISSCSSSESSGFSPPAEGTLEADDGVLLGTAEADDGVLLGTAENMF